MANTPQQPAPVGAPTPAAVAPADISVAVIHPGSRVEKVAVPLRESAMDVAIDPPNAYDYDIVLADNADRDLGREVLRKPLHDATLVYRMRGDVFRELELWGMHRLKKWAATDVVLPNVDACIAVTDRLAGKFERETGVPSASAGLVKDPAEWPTVDHTAHELRCVTLTNADYWRKVEPLIEWAPVVDAVLDDVGGRWRICGDGEHAEKLEIRLRGYDHIEFAGYVDAQDELADANCMLHASRLDGQPNAILEGLAAGLPVVTNDWPEFAAYGPPLHVVTDTAALRERLSAYSDPEMRAERGEAGSNHLHRRHSAAAVARDYERFFASLLDT
jgi:hypothetical protein